MHRAGCILWNVESLHVPRYFPRLHNKLKIVAINTTARIHAQPLEINLAMRPNRIITPTEKTKHYVRVEVVQPRLDQKPVPTEPKRMRTYNFSAFPPTSFVRDPQMQPANFVNPHVVRLSEK